MGQLATQAQNVQMQAMNPQRQMKQLLEKSWPRIAAVMPQEMSEKRLYQMYVSTINREPQLASCSVESVLSCFMRCTSLGLEPSNVNGLGMAYILPFGNKNMRTGQKEAMFVLGYRGMIALARRSGQLQSIHAQAVYQGDEFDYWEDETGQHFKFRATRGVPHTEATLTDVYVNAQLLPAGSVFVHMTKEEVEAVKRRSPAGNKGPWRTDYEAMALKTVVRRSFKWLPVSVEAQSAAVSDETTPDYSELFRPLPDETVDDSPVDVSVDESEQPQQETQPEAEPSPVDVKRAEMIRRFQALGVASDAEACETITKILNREVKASDELTEAELDKVLGQLKASVKEGE